MHWIYFYLIVQFCVQNIHICFLRQINFWFFQFLFSWFCQFSYASIINKQYEYKICTGITFSYTITRCSRPYKVEQCLLFSGRCQTSMTRHNPATTSCKTTGKILSAWTEIHEASYYSVGRLNHCKCSYPLSICKI